MGSSSTVLYYSARATEGHETRRRWEQSTKGLAQVVWVLRQEPWARRGRRQVHWEAPEVHKVP